MAEITVRHEIDTDEATFWSKVFFDEAFNKKLFEGVLKFPGWSVVEFKDDASKTFRRVKVDTPTADLPGPLKKALGEKFSYTEDGTFDKATKKYSFKVTPSAMPDKIKLSGEIYLEPIGDKKVRRVCKVTAEAKVFVIGGMIEDRILSETKTAYDNGAAYTNRFIKEQGL
jgi:hypothetical protein